MLKRMRFGSVWALAGLSVAVSCSSGRDFNTNVEASAGAAGEDTLAAEAWVTAPAARPAPLAAPTQA